MDELAFVKRAIRVYRRTFAHICDIAFSSESTLARDIAQILREGEWALAALRAEAPASIDPTRARVRKHLATLEEYGP